MHAKLPHPKLLVPTTTTIEQLEREVKLLGTAYDDLLIEAAGLRKALENVVEQIDRDPTGLDCLYAMNAARAAIRRGG